MNWSDFHLFAIPSVALWLAAAITIYTKQKSWIYNSLMVAGILVFTSFIISFWIHLERPLMRTMGETRLWYSLFIAIFGYIAFKRWEYKWLISFTAIVASVFVFVNLLKPEIHSKSLMPALQSIWFVPHVSSYILSYSMFGAATIGAIIALVKRDYDKKLLGFIDSTIYVGYGLLMLGLFMGAIWAKEAWGHYWSWDPKETWAFITSAAYLCYIHLRLTKTANKHPQIALYVAIAAFILLMITWLGVSYLPSAQGSIHVY